MITSKVDFCRLCSVKGGVKRAEHTLSLETAEKSDEIYAKIDIEALSIKISGKARH